MWIDASPLDEPEQLPPEPLMQQFAMLRESRNVEPMAVSSSKAIVLAARRLNHVLQTHGPQAIALWVSPRTSREARHLAGRFARKALRSARLITDPAEGRSVIERGEVRGLWVFGSDMAAEMCRSKRGLSGIDCVIVEDVRYPTPSAAGDVFFPVQRSEEDDSAEARPGWWWIQQVALAMGFRAGFAFASEEQIREEITRGVGV